MSIETVAIFKSNKTKNFDVGNFYDRDYGRVGSIPTKWQLKVEVRIDTESKDTIIEAYYDGNGHHPFGGNLSNKTIERKKFSKQNKEESFEFLKELIEKYNAKELEFAEPKIMDHWSGEKVILNCGITYNFITTELFDSCGLEYSDDFTGTKNYRGKTPDPIPLYIYEDPDAFVSLIEVHDRNGINKRVMGLKGWVFEFVKADETKSRVDFHFIEYDSRFREAFTSDFKEMIKYNYCFGETIPELVNIARDLVRRNFLTQKEYDFLFPDSTEIVDPVDVVVSSANQAAKKYGFEDEKREERFKKALKNYKGPVDQEECPKLAAVALS